MVLPHPDLTAVFREDRAPRRHGDKINETALKALSR